MKSTITDVAKQAGVSMKTVSRVLNNEPNVAKKTREKVLASARELRYSPNLAARGLASSKSYMIALAYDNSPSLNYISPIQQGAIMACRENGFHLVVEPLEMRGTDVSEEMEQLLERLPVDGIILTSPLCDNPDVLAILKRLGVAYVSVSPSKPEEGVACVVMDNTQASYEMTQFLIQQGHRNIGFIKGHPEHNSSTLRYLGFVNAMEAAAIDLNMEWVVDGDFSFRSGVKAAEALLSNNDRPTAIFASNDDMAAGVVSVANRLGISVPGQLSVGGFDDTPLASILWPQLTTVKQPIYQMGHRAASLLINPPETDECLGIYNLDHQLIVRESTAQNSTI